MKWMLGALLLIAATIASCEDSISAPTYNSVAIGGGLYQINFTVPVDVFNLHRSFLIVGLDADYWSQPSRPYTQMNVYGDNLIILGNHDRRTKWKCRSVYFTDIANHHISMGDIGYDINRFTNEDYSIPDEIIIPIWCTEEWTHRLDSDVDCDIHPFNIMTRERWIEYYKRYRIEVFNNTASCTAIANQPFVITIVQTGG